MTDSRQEMTEELNEIFATIPACTYNERNEPVIPADNLFEVFRTYGDNHDGVQILKLDEEEKFLAFLQEHTDIRVTPQIVMDFVAAKMQSTEYTEEELFGRGRDSGQSGSGHGSRSSSQGSSSRGFALPPKTPSDGRTPDSPFENGRRQRTTPLQSTAPFSHAPTSWNGRRPAPAARRKSDAGYSGRASSDSESGLASPLSNGRRSRPPSNPASPRNGRMELPWDPSSPYINSPPMNPHSRTRSHGQYNVDSLTSPQYDHHDSSLDAAFAMQRSHRDRRHRAGGVDSDSDYDEDDQTLGMHHRSAYDSSASLAAEEELDALQRANADLQKKYMESEQTLQRRMTEHESELEDMQNKLDEAKAELSATKREEKELRAKERTNIMQISALEGEVAKMQKNLDTARASYQSLQKQYQEQCAESERYRNTLRVRDQELKHYQDQSITHALDIKKHKEAQEAAEQSAAALTKQLEIAEEAANELNSQKDENMKLKETIDRMRYEMDQLRTSQVLSVGKDGSGANSHEGSLSRSLGMELSRMNIPSWPSGEDGSGDEGEDEENVDGDETDREEDVLETIITRRTRRPTRSTKKGPVRIEQIQEYCDVWTQHETSEFTSSQIIQTDPEPKIPKVSFSIQTDDRPVESMAIQTVPEPSPVRPVMKEMEIQTDVLELPEVSAESSRSSTPDEDLASSSSTVRPATPKQEIKHDLPPSYSQVTRAQGKARDLSDVDEDEERKHRDMLVASETIKKWHDGLHFPIAPVPGGVSIEALEDWQALKEELGIDCLAIDKVLEVSTKTNEPRIPKSPSERGGRRFNRFYNIYNTHFYGNGNGERKDVWPTLLNNGLTSSLLVAFGLTAFSLAVMGPSSAPQYAFPGASTSYDRQAWQQFNSFSRFGEGVTDDGTAAVWDFIGRVSNGAARIAAGRTWPPT